MANSILQPASDHVLVIDLPRTTTIDGIELPDNVRQQEMCFGRVIAVGPAVSAFTSPKSCICYGPYAGKPAVIDGVQFRLVREAHIEAYVNPAEKTWWKRFLQWIGLSKKII